MHISESSYHRRRSAPSAGVALVLLLGLAAPLSGCAAMQDSGAHAQAVPAVQSFHPVADYVAYMRQLTDASSVHQKGLYQQAAESNRKNPSANNQLRLALALSTLDAPYGDAAKARQLLKDLLNPANQMPRDVESLTRVALNAASQRVSLEERNAILRKQIDDAEAKIQALTTIEQTIEQPTTSTTDRVPK